MSTSEPTSVRADHVTPIFFTGTGSQYFGIWIVNLLLSIVTLGIYSAWAKVRRKKYFYHHTLIDGVGFDYHASPIAILKGRAIAFALFLLYVFGEKLSVTIPIVLGLLFVLFLPWIVVRSATFNARNSSHRGLRFNFAGSLGDAAKVFLALPVLTGLTLGLLLPYLAQQRNRFLLGGHRFGSTPFAFHAGAKGFYKIYGQALLMVLAIALLVGAVVGVVVAASAGGLSADGIAARMQDPIVQALLPLMMMGMYLVILVLPAAFIQARVGNLVWSTTTLDHLAFRSDLRARDMAMLYVTNLLAIVVSLGLLVPWAHVRMARYRAEHIALLGEGDFERFVGDKKQEARATGESIAEMFDVDLSFG